MAASTRTLSLIVALAMGLAACQGDDAPNDADARAASAQTVTTALPQTRSLSRSITVSGPVAAVEEMQLGVELSGLRVTRLAVEVGQQVRRGQVLLTLDHRMLDADMAQANAALREAEEESGLTDLRVEPELFDLDRHWIPGRGDVPGHWHYDARYVVRTTGSEEFVVSEESLDLAWRDIAAIAEDPASDESMRRMARKWLAVSR